MIHKSTPLSGQLRAMKIGETFTINPRSPIPIRTIQQTAVRLRKEGYDYSISTAGMPKGACTITRIEPRQRTDHEIVVTKAIPSSQALTTQEIATTFEIDYTQAGEPKHMQLPVIYDRYEYWNKRLKEAGEDAANKYIAKLVEDTLQ